jgi:tetratricopeptide (TPR) repeat protein
VLRPSFRAVTAFLRSRSTNALRSVRGAISRSIPGPIAIFTGGVKATLRSLRGGLLWWFETFKEHPTASLILLAALAGAVALAVGLVLNETSPRSTILVAPFELPPASNPPLAVTGRTIANLLADDLQAIVGGAADFAAKLSSPEPVGESVARPLLGLVEEPPSVGLEVEGISEERIVAEWNRIRQRQNLITGDVMFGPGRLTLRARIATRANWWEVRRSPVSAKSLESACHDLAQRILSRLNPDILGLFYLSQERSDQALALFNRWVEREPERAEAHYYLGLALDLAGPGRADEAIAAYQRALELNPKFLKALNNLGAALANKGKDQEAIEAYQKALKLAPRDYVVLYNLGVSYSNSGQLPAAIASYRKALKLEPKFLDARINLGVALRRNGELDAAVATYQEALKLYPENPRLLNNLAVALDAKRDYTQALEVVRKALQLKPKHPEALDTSCSVLRHMRRYKQALAACHKAVTLSPRDADLRVNLAFTLQKMGRNEESQREFREAHLLDPNVKAPEE